ncbi:MAG TPA: HAD-IIB family hydrolase [Thermoanaerobaculales bacterium]|nr:HAD-IIB family hydrolase [Thermoanaerobaculales bacterium]
MRLRAVLTDLDGTLLEPDGSLCAEAAAALQELREQGVAVLPLTSKTAAEVEHLLARLDLPGPGGFENGAGIVERGGATTMTAGAIPMDELRSAASRLRRVVAAPLRTLEELTDQELAALTGMTGGDLARVRQRRATLPMVVDERWDGDLRGAAPARMQLVRGNRFLHLQGRHAKADVVAQLLATAPGGGVVVAFGDAPNDLELLRCGDVAVIVPSASGAHRDLEQALAGAVVAPAPHGRGWAAVVRRLVAAAAE